MCGTKFNQAEDEASDPVIGKCVFSRCDESRLGTEKLTRCTICNVFGDLKAFHNFHEIQMRNNDRSAVNATKAN